MWKTNHRTKRRKWRKDICISTRKKDVVYVRAHPGSSSTTTPGRGCNCSGCTTAASAAAHCEISTVLGGPVFW